MIAILCTMISCAEEGPFRMGKLETSIELQYATPNMAEIKVTLPRNNDNLLNGEYCYAYLATRPFSDAGKDWWDDRISGERISNNKDQEFVFRFTDLDPDTQYYLILNSRVDFNEPNDSNYENYYYYPDFSFTTAKEGDWSEFNMATCELIEAIPGYTKIRIKLPKGLQFSGNGGFPKPVLEADTNSEMSDPILGTLESYNSERTEAVFNLIGLKNSNYYLRLKGYYEFFSYTINEEVTIKVENTLDLIGVEMPGLISSLDFAGDNFSVFRLSLPEGTGLNWDIYNHRNFQASWRYENSSESKELHVFWGDSQSWVKVCIPEKIAKGTDIVLTVKGYVTNGYAEFIHDFECKMTYNEDDATIPKPTCDIVFSGNDYTLVKVNYPSDISFSSNSRPQYYLYNYGSSDIDKNETVYSLTGDIIIFRTPSKLEDEVFIKAEGTFNVYGAYVENGIISVDGPIKLTGTDRKLFNISSSLNKDILKIIIECPSGFHFDVWNGLSLKCVRTSGGNPSDLFSVSDYPDIKNAQKIEFSINKAQYQKLQSGEKYILAVSGFNLMYGSIFINDSRDVFDLDWVYNP